MRVCLVPLLVVVTLVSSNKVVLTAGQSHRFWKLTVEPNTLAQPDESGRRFLRGDMSSKLKAENEERVFGKNMMEEVAEKAVDEGGLVYKMVAKEVAAKAVGGGDLVIAKEVAAKAVGEGDLVIAKEIARVQRHQFQAERLRNRIASAVEFAKTHNAIKALSLGGNLMKKSEKDKGAIKKTTPAMKEAMATEFGIDLNRNAKIRKQSEKEVTLNADVTSMEEL